MATFPTIELEQIELREGKIECLIVGNRCAEFARGSGGRGWVLGAEESCRQMRTWSGDTIDIFSSAAKCNDDSDCAKEGYRTC